MLDTFPVALIVGAALGYLAGLGVGGGSLLILWLTLVLHTPGQEARLINLMFFITAAGSVSIFRWKQGCRFAYTTNDRHNSIRGLSSVIR